MSDPAWLPVGFRTPRQSVVRRRASCGDDWQIFDCGAAGRVLLVEKRTAEGWVAAGLVPEGEIFWLSREGEARALLEGGHGYRLESLSIPEAPEDLSDAEAFAAALAESLKIDPSFDTSDAVYVERLSRVLPTTAIGEHLSPDRLLGIFITGGVDVSIHSERRVLCLAPWMSRQDIDRVKGRLGLQASGSDAAQADQSETDETLTGAPATPFALPGRPVLQDFLNEHVIDIIRNPERYRRLGVGFPGAILLHGPPGSGKTYAIEQLIDYLGWPCLSVDCGSIGSPYIHETGRKIAALFDEAAKAAPSVLVVDEIDAFLSARDDGAGGQHRVEEVAEFLRRIPEAAKSQVLVVGMTNRLSVLDPAIVRRGRFDHILEVGMPSKEEALSALRSLTAKVPVDEALSLERLATELGGRPMSDIAFVVKDACRRAARRGAERIHAIDLEDALGAAGSKAEEKRTRRIGFV